ncbi:MAG: cytochrome C [Proteobacteria bacterium]|nr:cytochrome C [Pseudomonadota bacterium]
MSTRSFVSLLIAASCCSSLPAGAQTALPEGNGKQIVETACIGCHELSRTTSAGYTPADWRNVLSMMVNIGVPLPGEQYAIVAEYLAKNFPEKPKPPAVIVPGSVQISIKEWPVPTPGSRPHDPLAAADGSIWYSGQMANVLGRLDPASGQIKEYPIAAPMSGPHGLVEDKSGAIWYTANFKGAIGKFDPKSGQFAEYPLPDPDARDPHTPLFDQKGALWFTVQSANMVGRLLPETGEIKLLKMPSPRSLPYGMVINSQGVPFFDEFGTNKLASIDPRTMQIHEYVLPSPQARPRRIAITKDDVIWYSDYGRGYLGRLDPETGKVTEWPSPGGPQSRPYGIAVLDDVIWYSESGVKPNTIVRFDRKTEAFQSWPIPSGGGVVRNMMTTRDGKLALACSGVNGLALVEIR